MINKYGKLEYELRDSQRKASEFFTKYFLNSQETQPSLLFNAVMRWGKCLTSLVSIYNFNNNPEVIKQNKQIKNVLILTFFPDTEDSWARLFGPDGKEAQAKFDNFNFISLQNKRTPDPNKVNVFFGSFQEIYTGTATKKSIFYNRNYDLLILDEYHYGAYNSKAKSNFKQTYSEDVDFSDYEHSCDLLDNKLHYKYKLSLSGTPYKIFQNSDEFKKENTFTFTYFDEQKDKLENPNSDYKDSPTLKLYSVNIQKDSISLEDKIDFLLKNTEIFGDNKKEPLFINKGGASFWMIEKVKDAEMIENYLNENYPDEYNIINLYKGQFNRGNKTLGLLNKELENNEDKHSIILSYNKLTLGVTVPKIESVVFLRNITTAELYMQAGCRAKSQYSSDNKKNNLKKEYAYLISFDIENDYQIFQQITQNGLSEKEFVKMLPINFVNYDPLENETEISPITGDREFLSALAKTPVKEMIRKSISSRIKCNLDLSDDLLEALNNISSIGNKNDKAIKSDTLTDIEKNDINERKINPIKKAEKDGQLKGRKDREFGKPERCIKTYSEKPELQAAYERGYHNGFNLDIPEYKEKETTKQKESDNAIARKIEILVERFLYTIIGDYYRENKFPDIKDKDNVPDEFFSSMLGFPRNLFIKLYDDVILDNNYINNVIVSFKERENKNTPYIGLSNKADYEIFDLMEITEKDIQEENEKVIDNIKDNIKDIVRTVIDNDDINDKYDKSHHLEGQKYIYIAVPSEFMKGLLYCLVTLKDFLPQGSKKFEEVTSYIEYFSKLTHGIKIGETHREPTVRLEELNGYTVNTGNKHLLFDLKYFEPVDENKSDTEFHSLLVEKGYKRINDDVRREFFDMDADKAHEELLKYKKQGNLSDEINIAGTITPEQYREFLEWKKSKTKK